MNIVLAMLDARPVAASSIGFLTVTGLFALVFPLRGGNGDHAHAGPGALTVPQLTERVKTAARPRVPRPEQLARLAAQAEYLPKRVRQKFDLPAGYVGKHRLIEWPPRFTCDVQPPRAEVTIAWSALH